MNGHKKSSPTREVTVVVASVSGLKTALAGSDRRVFVRVRSAAESKWQRTACAPRSAAAWDEVFAVNHVHRGQLFVEVVEEGRKKASFSAVAPLEAQGRFQLPLAPGVALTCTVRRGSPLTSFAETEALIVALSGRLERADADRKRRFFAWVRDITRPAPCERTRPAPPRCAGGRVRRVRAPVEAQQCPSRRF